MRKQLLLSLLIVILFSFQLYSQTWIPLTKENMEQESFSVTVVEASTIRYKAHVIINGLNDHIVKNGEVKYHCLTLGEPHYLRKTGDPMLPLLVQSLALPDNSSFNVSILEKKWVDVEVGMVYPAQNDENRNEFCLNMESYSNPFSPDIVSVGEMMEWRGIKNLKVSICPFKYNPTTGRLSVLQDFVFQADFIHEDATKNMAVPLVIDDPMNLFDNVAIETVDSVSSTPNYRSCPDSITSGEKYLIIIGYGNGIAGSESLKRFRRWKAMMGYQTEVWAINQTGITCDSIKKRISQSYNNGTKYVLFIGDDYSIPMAGVPYDNGEHNRIYIQSDYWYGCLSGDNDAEAEIPIGRLPACNESEFKNMVNKIIRYEGERLISDEVLLVAHYEYAPSGYQQNCNYIYNGNYSTQVTFSKAYGADSFHGGTNATNAFVVEKINNGSNIINYRGHGGIDFWGNIVWNINEETFYSTEISNMDDGTNCVFFSIACNTGDITYHYTTSMLETFLRSDHGAVAFLGCTASSDTDANDEYNINLFKKLLNNNIRRLGDLNIAAHIANIGTGYYQAKNCAFSYICGGDPSLKLWTNIPLIMGDISLFPREDSITICTQLNGQYVISLSTVDGLFIQTIHASSPTCTFAKPTGKFFLSIRKEGFVPYVAYYDSVTNFIQNMTFMRNAYYDSSPLKVGEGYVGTLGPVNVGNGGRLVLFNGADGVTIEDCFRCEKGGILEIK